jgi:tetratricopeptide (TPR) repeat protein
MVPALRVVIVLSVVGLLVVGGLIVRQAVFGPSDDTPKTEGQRAVLASEEAVKASPNDPASRVKLAAAYLEQGSPSLAKEQARIAIRLAPKEPSAYYVLGLSEARLGRSAEAVTNLKKAAETEGQMAQFYQDAYLALAKAQDGAGDDKGAVASFQKAIDNGPENALALYERGSYFERKRQFKNALYDYGWALTYAPNYEPAQAAYNQLAKQYPDLVKELASQEASAAKAK